MHECDQCPKVFSRKNNLYEHVRNVHVKIKPHQCGICSKAFSRKQHKEVHLRTCSRSVGIPILKKIYYPSPDLKFHPVLRSSVLGGIVTEWELYYPLDYRYYDPQVLLNASTKAMKDVILKQLYATTKKLKFTMSIHVIFAKAEDPEVKTIPSVVLNIDPSVVYIGTDIEHCLKLDAEELWDKIQTYEGNGSGWIYERFERLDTGIYSF